MSLTRDEWLQMWESIKKIERLADYLYFTNLIRSNEIKRECEFIKKQIQSVIGQME
jgi:hypothetical protein